MLDKVIAFDHLRQKSFLLSMPLADVVVGYNKAVMELKQLAELPRTVKEERTGRQTDREVTPLFDKRAIPLAIW